MNKHTLGPWVRHGTAVYFAKCLGGFSLHDCPDAEENASLCAAAPDLLEACENFLAVLGSKIRDGKDRPEYAEAFYQAEKKMCAAVKKARGES